MRYDINLIRQSVVPERQRNVIFSVASFAALAYVLTLLAVIVSSVSNLKVTDVYASEFESLQQEFAASCPGGVPSSGEIEGMLGRLKPQLRDLTILVDGKLEFASLWGGIAAAVPDSVWLTGVRVVAPRNSGSSNRKTRSTGKSDHAGIRVEGAVAADFDRGGELIRAFARRLEDGARLTEHVGQARFVETGLQTIGGKSVIGFEITCPFE